MIRPLKYGRFYSRGEQIPTSAYFLHFSGIIHIWIVSFGILFLFLGGCGVVSATPGCVHWLFLALRTICGVWYLNQDCDPQSHIQDKCLASNIAFLTILHIFLFSFHIFWCLDYILQMGCQRSNPGGCEQDEHIIPLLPLYASPGFKEEGF